LVFWKVQKILPHGGDLGDLKRVFVSNLGKLLRGILLCTHFVGISGVSFCLINKGSCVVFLPVVFFISIFPPASLSAAKRVLFCMLSIYREGRPHKVKLSELFKKHTFKFQLRLFIGQKQQIKQRFTFFTLLNVVPHRIITFFLHYR